MTERLRVSTADGKYTVIQEQAGGMRFLRHGEPWPAADAEFAHVGLILALAYDLAAAREELLALSGVVAENFKKAERMGLNSPSSPGPITKRALERAEKAK